MLIEMLTELPEQAQEWVWNEVIPVGQLTLLMGEPGVGKSLFAMDAIARLTRGRCGARETDQGPVGSVMLFAGEDDIRCTIRSRLDAAGADLSLVSLIPAVVSMNQRTGRLERSLIRECGDVDDLVEFLKECRKGGDPVRLIVIDPVNSFLEQAERGTSEEFRAMIAALVDLAVEWNLAILMVTQAERVGKGADATLRPIVPMLAWAARSVWKIVADDVDPRRRLLLPVKTNLCETPPGLGFFIEQQVIRWDERPVDVKAERERREGSPAKVFEWEKSPDELARVTAWVRHRLRDGAVLSRTLRNEASAHQMSVATLRRALAQLGCRKGKQAGSNGKWFWELPGSAEQDRGLPESRPVEVAQSCSDWATLNSCEYPMK